MGSIPLTPPKIRTFAQFLESSPHDVFEEVQDLAVGAYTYGTLTKPDIRLHCGNDFCGGERIFHTDTAMELSSVFANVFMVYYCRNCERNFKIFALVIMREKPNSESGSVQKLGEYPTYAPPMPSRIFTLVGEDRELFLKGRRAELNGLGIGAFAYYRRVVERQKNRIIGEIRKVAVRLGTSTEALKLFDEAMAETQFKSAIEKVNAAIPQSLKIEGQNPLTLLHPVLSQGLHDKTDEECLEMAKTVRLVLAELAERTTAALKDDAELKEAIKKLNLRRSQP